VANDPTGPPQTRSSPGPEDPGSPDNPRPLTKAAAQPPAQEAEAVHIVRHDGDDARVATSGPCPRCGHDLVTVLRYMVTERSEAWRDGGARWLGDGWRDGLEGRCRATERGVTGAQWRMCRQIVAILERDTGRTDADLAVMLVAPVADVRQAVAILYRQRKADRCWDYVVLRPQPARQERAA
jgi:hypothetical protein